MACPLTLPPPSIERFEIKIPSISALLARATGDQGFEAFEAGAELGRLGAQRRVVDCKTLL
jgi:hypothetical protein